MKYHRLSNGISCVKSDKKIMRGIVKIQLISFTAVSIAALFGIGYFLYQANAQFTVDTRQEVIIENGIFEGTKKISTQIVAANYQLPTSKKPVLEIHVANNGVTLLRGARVISISDNTLHAVTTFDNADFMWEIWTTYFTKYFSPNGEQETFEDIRRGDTITVTGRLTKGGFEPIIDAQFIREN